MNNEMHIKWDTGSMDIHMTAFFPCSTAKLNKLLKVIQLDWMHREELILQLKTFFEEMIPFNESGFKMYAKAYQDAHQKIADLTAILKSKRLPNGVYINKGQFETFKKELKQAKVDERNNRIRALNCKKDKEKYEKLLENLKKKG